MLLCHKDLIDWKRVLRILNVYGKLPLRFISNQEDRNFEDNFYKEGRNVIPEISFKGKFVISSIAWKLRFLFINFENIFVTN